MVDRLHRLNRAEEETLMPDPTRYATTHDAASILHVSDGHVLDLIEHDVLPATTVGGVRVIKLAAVLRLKAESDAKRRAMLDELTTEVQDLGFHD